MISTLKTLAPYLLVRRWRYLRGALSLAGKTVAGAAIPVALRYGIDRLAAGVNLETLLRFGLLLIGLAAVKAFCQYWMRWILIGISRDIEYDLRQDLTAHLLRMQQRFFRIYPTGDLMSRAVNDLAAVRMLLGPGLMYSLDVVLTFIVVLTVMSVTDWRLTCLIFLPVPLVSYLVRRFGRLTHDRFQQTQERLSDLTAMVQENLVNVRVVRAYAQGAAEQERFGERNDRLLQENLKLVAIWRVFYPTMEALIGLTYVIVIGFGGWQAVRGAITLGSFVMFLSYLAILTWPMIGLGWVINLVERGTASLERINELLRARPLALEPSPEPLPAELRGDLEFQDVTVYYPNSDRPALENVSLFIPAGEIVAVVGAVGAGKTTLLNLAPRLVEPASGRVLIDGVEVRSLPLETLRAAIGFVPQESFLFSRSVRDNLLFGAPEAQQWQVEDAASIAHILEEIEAFPEGFETAVGERGVTLSGGQKQRAALARAVLRDPRILVLDDALASVDAGAEAAILERLRVFMQNRTTLMATHRLPAARLADRILVLDDGRLVESGTHIELMAARGPYAKMVRRQALEEELVRDG